MSSGLIIMPDIADFVSPVDGTIVHGRKSLREHNKRNNVTNAADYTEEWKQKAKERAKLFTPGSGYDRERRIQHIVRAYEQHSRSKRR